MAAGHGGARPGAGRKPKVKTEAPAAATRYDDALAYLAAVVRGDEPPDGLRIAAAKAVLPFQEPRKRAPVESPAPTKIRAASQRTAERVEQDDFARRAAEVRRKFKKESS